MKHLPWSCRNRVRDVPVTALQTLENHPPDPRLAQPYGLGCAASLASLMMALESVWNRSYHGLTPADLALDTEMRNRTWQKKSFWRRLRRIHLT